MCCIILHYLEMDNIEDHFDDYADCSKLNDINNDDGNLDVSEEDISLALEYDDQEDGNAKEIHTRIEDLYQKIEEKQKVLHSKREELRLLEVDSDVEVFEMKHEIANLQSKIEDGKIF